jgi:hypothetical protein
MGQLDKQENICQEFCSEIILDGSQSSYPDGEIVTHTWEYKRTDYEDYTSLGEGEVLTVPSSDLESGTYDVRLTVTSNDGFSAIDQMILAIQETCNVCVAKGDLDFDGDVDGNDLAIFSYCFGKILK